MSKGEAVHHTGGSRTMKAWYIRADNVDYTGIVFAETRGKAKTLALNTDNWCDSDFTDLQVTRCPEADCRYTGQKELDWENPDDRLFMVKELCFCCVWWADTECEECSAKEYCDRYEKEESE